MSVFTMRRSSPAVRHLRVARTRSTRTGASTDTSQVLHNAVATLEESAMPILVLGAVGAIFGGTLWGLKGMLAGIALGTGAGFGVGTVSAASRDGGPDASHPDFSLPTPGPYTPPSPTGGTDITPPLPFPSAPAFVPTPSFWTPVSTVNSRSRVDGHRGIAAGNTVQFIAQYAGPLKGADDTSNEVKLAAKVMVARPPLSDQDPAYGVEVLDIVQENDVTPGLDRPAVGQRMVVSIEQVLTAGAE